MNQKTLEMCVCVCVCLAPKWKFQLFGVRVSMLLKIKERGFPTKNSLQSTDFGINRDLV